MGSFSKVFSQEKYVPLCANLYTTRVVLRKKRSSTIFSDFREIITIYCGLFCALVL